MYFHHYCHSTMSRLDINSLRDSNTYYGLETAFIEIVSEQSVTTVDKHVILSTPTLIQRGREEVFKQTTGIIATIFDFRCF